MTEFEITQGDYGVAYIGIVEGVDLSSYAAKVYVWNSSDVLLINGVACTVTFTSPDTQIRFTPAAADFATVAAGTYRGAFVLSKTGATETLKPFTIQVLAKPPGA